MEDRYLRYKHLNIYLKEIFGERTLKICIDGGFTCPNRDGTCGIGGCIFCGEKGSGEQLKKLPIKKQIENHLNSYRGERANKFIAYFQNFTNTYDTIENLKRKYEEALNADSRIVGLEVATRPDCITEQIVELLESYTSKYYVCVELGLQTSNDEIGKVINRGYNSEVFTEAVRILRKHNINVVAHIMVGLPSEQTEGIEQTVNFINNHDIQGIKIHSCYVIKGTKLCKLYEQKLYKPITFDYYIDRLVYIITHLRKDIIIHRVSGDAPKDLLVAPEWNLHKRKVLAELDRRLRVENLYQGMFFGKP